jgi:transposase InsO family protein
LSKAGITHLSKTGYIPKLSFSDYYFCEHCQYGKQVAASHLTSPPRVSTPLDLVHSDICGPMLYQSLGGASYFVTFIDDATWKVWAYLTQTKDRVFTIFKEWLAMVENQMDRKLKCLRSDNGGEYKSDEFIQFYRERGIRREFTAPYRREQNGVAERMSRTIQERIVSMLHHSGLTDGFWAEVLLTAVHIINMSPSRPLGLKIQLELWT